MKKLILCMSLICFLGCDDDPNTFFSLGEFRVLTLQADQPEIDGTAVAPTTVNITPYVSDINAGGRNVSLTILACVDPGLDLGNQPRCDASAPGTQTIIYPTVNTSTLGSKFTGAFPSFAVTIPAGLLTGQNPQVKFNGLNYLVTIDFQAGSETFSVYKRIVVSQRTTKNHNPKIDHIFLNGHSNDDLKDQDELSIKFASGFAPEHYDVLDGNGNVIAKKEEYTTSWFSYKGTTDLSRTFLDEKNTFTLDIDANNPFVIAILRDDRGGIDFQIHD